MQGQEYDWINHLQWPAMVATLAAAWGVSSDAEHTRKWGFWLFLLSNLLWIAWGSYTGGWALVILQFGLALINSRGAKKTSEKQDAPA